MEREISRQASTPLSDEELLKIRQTHEIRERHNSGEEFKADVSYWQATFRLCDAIPKLLTEIDRLKEASEGSQDFVLSPAFTARCEETFKRKAARSRKYM
jgi:hypothetical protein